MFGRYDRWMYVHANICSFALKFRPDNGTKAVMGSPWFITIYPEGWYDCMCHISWRELKGFSDIIYRKPKWKHHGGIKIKTLVWLAVGARRKVRGYLKSLGFILWGLWICDPKFIAINQIIVEIFQSGSRKWTKRPTDIPTYGSMWLASLQMTCYWSNRELKRLSWKGNIFYLSVRSAFLPIIMWMYLNNDKLIMITAGPRDAYMQPVSTLHITLLFFFCKKLNKTT